MRLIASTVVVADSVKNLSLEEHLGRCAVVGKELAHTNQQNNNDRERYLDGIVMFDRVA